MFTVILGQIDDSWFELKYLITVKLLFIVWYNCFQNETRGETMGSFCLAAAVLRRQMFLKIKTTFPHKSCCCLQEFTEVLLPFIPASQPPPTKTSAQFAPHCWQWGNLKMCMVMIYWSQIAACNTFKWKLLWRLYSLSFEPMRETHPRSAAPNSTFQSQEITSYLTCDASAVLSHKSCAPSLCAPIENSR